MMRTTLRAWATSLVALLVASAGLFAVSAASTTTSVARMAVAAAVLSALATAAALLVTDPDERSVGRRVLWGGAVPLVVGLATVLVVAAAAGLGAALLAGLPWVLGTALICTVGGRLPDLRGLGGRSLVRRFRERSRGLPDLDRR